MIRYLSILFLFTVSILFAQAEDGSKLWLRFGQAKASPIRFTGINADKTLFAVKEFQKAWKEIYGKELSINNSGKQTLIIGTSRSKALLPFALSKNLEQLGNEGFIIKTFDLRGKQQTVITAKSEAGLLYGVYHLLRLIQTNELPDNLDIIENPSYAVRILNHWDNLDGSIERGYAGHSIWKWEDMPKKISPRYTEYARANASIGINGSVLDNVNASPNILRNDYLEKVKILAGIFRPFHIKVYLSINFSAPSVIGGVPTADPLNPAVIKWWDNKVNEIYRLIPDFGGFLVKANSEGLPGPQDFGRTHADGANMLADALKPHGGIVMWRAFVYSPDNDDRAKQAYNEFVPLDGKFRDNVIVQVKNGPIDFQPREPFSPLFGGLKLTKIMPEFQITQEYLGQSNHMVYQAPLWKECLDSDTYCQGKGSTVARITDGTLYKRELSAIAGVANIGEDTNWCGHHFAQANWYAFGRLAWNHNLTSEQIAGEWLKMTFNKDSGFVRDAKNMMIASREAVVNYMMPLGLHHLFAWEHHYGPEPWCDFPNARPDWLPKYYHQANEDGLGFDRSSRGTNYVEQYCSPLREMFDKPETCPEKYLLWFHHVPWNYKMKDGKTLWDELCYLYDSGVKDVRTFEATWNNLKTYVDKERFEAVKAKLAIQEKDAIWWKDACLLYFQEFSKQPIPPYIEAPVHKLDDLKKIKLNMASHN
ncbi:alpha-glucuronidase family glycosyl hydrolase [Paludibacter jiangxiensis]|uniref:Xylan alpha-1,2-glucuronidase n=1 Tax=Paludibacter jiangxiensis TaxID=681398 RepID=A0A161L8P9_9BACT|nr:alpha-glucuronidase family glycosyl hydrolase [Paludibacter jiangxiensis]GAT63574.1 alpha-glucuronidase [Paludibacter jiangxiensis]